MHNEVFLRVLRGKNTSAVLARHLSFNNDNYYYYLSFLSSIHEKANCIAILWTGSPHSLGSCLF